MLFPFAKIREKHCADTVVSLLTRPMPEEKSQTDTSEKEDRSYRPNTLLDVVSSNLTALLIIVAIFHGTKEEVWQQHYWATTILILIACFATILSIASTFAILKNNRRLSSKETIMKHNQTVVDWLVDAGPNEKGTGIFLVSAPTRADGDPVTTEIILDLTYAECIRRATYCISFKWVPHRIQRSIDASEEPTCTGLCVDTCVRPLCFCEGGRCVRKN